MNINLQYIPRNQLDTARWDRCINEAANPLIYACSFYLDHMAKHWDALVWGDYEAVMPLMWNKKWGIKYLYQPAFTQQTGIFTGNDFNSALSSSFLAALQKHFPFAEIFLNYAHAKNNLQQQSNFILPLHLPYEQLQLQYKHDLVKNLKRAARFNLSYSSDVDYKVILQAYKKLYGNQMPHVTHEDYSRFENLCSFLYPKNIVVRIVKEDDEPLSVALLLHYQNRLYLIESVTWPAGRHKAANHYLIDQIIREFSNSNTVLDFEGSDLPGVAHFYSNFGGINQPYFFYRYNNLPWWIKWLK